MLYCPELSYRRWMCASDGQSSTFASSLSKINSKLSFEDRFYSLLRTGHDRSKCALDLRSHPPPGHNTGSARTENSESRSKFSFSNTLELVRKFQERVFNVKLLKENQRLFPFWWRQLHYDSVQYLIRCKWLVFVSQMAIWRTQTSYISFRSSSSTLTEKYGSTRENSLQQILQF